jgi:hypothetical protein
MRIAFVEPLTETDNPKDPAFAVLAHCSKGSEHWGDLAEGQRPFALLDDVGDSGYRFYSLGTDKTNPRRVVIYASVEKGKEIMPFRMTGYKLIDVRRCAEEAELLVRVEAGHEEKAVVARWHERVVLLSLTKIGTQQPYSYNVWADSVAPQKPGTRAAQRIDSCYWH